MRVITGGFIMPWVNKEDLTVKELNSLCPEYGLFKDINYKKIEYFKDDDGKIYELSLCTDGSLNERMKLLEKSQKKKQIVKSFGL